MTEQPMGEALPPAAKSGNRALKGCAIGCGAALFLAIIVTVLLFVFGNIALDRMDESGRPYIQREYEEWTTSGDLPADRAAAYEVLMQDLNGPHAGPWTTICVMILMIEHMEDQTIDDDEIAEAEQLHADIESTEGLGLVYYGRFLQVSAERQRIANQLPLMVQ